MRSAAHTVNLTATSASFWTRVASSLLILTAAIIYILGIRGHHPFGSDEAYSIWAAAKPGPGAIIAIPVLWDPGKQVLYYIVLHYFVRLWGDGESAARSLSLLFALGALGLVYALARQVFDAEIGVAALAFWAFNPLAVFFAWQARGYSMFLFVGLAQMIAVWRLRMAPATGRMALCGVLTATLLYTHLGGLLILGGEAVMLMRDFVRGRRDPQLWAAMGIAALLFTPYLPIALAQSRQLISGHWLDWAGIHDYSLMIRITATLAAGTVGLLMMFGPQAEHDPDEPLRWLAAWSLLPILALIAGSIVIRPMFNLRYVIPSLAALAILVAAGLSGWSVKLRNLAAAGFALACLLVIPFDYPAVEPWPQLAGRIAAANHPAQPIFFESGFTARAGAGAANGGYPFGYYAVPFNYYFHGPNPRVMIPGYDPAAARAMIAAEVYASGGGWLISWKDKAAASELPDQREFQATMVASQPPLAVYRIVRMPLPPAKVRQLAGARTTRP
jgi:mannosyltransferase